MSIGLFHRRLCLAGVFAVWMGAGAVWAAGETERLGFFESRKVVKQADEALRSGEHAQARELYGRLITGLETDDARRSQAIYRSALSALAQKPADSAAARQFLDQLPGSFKGGDRGLEAATLSGLLTELAKLTEVAEQATAKAVAAEKAVQDAPAPEAPSADQDKLERLETQNARLRRELKEAQAELAKKEEALEKLKEVVVGKGG